MPNHVLLNNVDHKDLRIDTRHGPGMGDDVMMAPTFAAEFRNVQSHYPIVFSKARDGSFQPMALFGLQEGQNLFLDDDGWDATYVPLAIERQPFLIGVAGDEPMVHVDLDSPRVGTGEALFLEHGGTSELLERISSVLRALHEGLQSTPAFVAMLLDLDLLESFVLDVELDDGSRSRLAGFYTINEERLAALEGHDLQRLSRAGYLEAVYMAIASLAHFRGLIERINHVRAADA